MTGNNRIHTGERHGPAHQGIGPLLVDAVLRTGGDVIVVPGERMPSVSGLAAVLRY